MSLNENTRTEKEFKLVTDGNSLYRLHPSFKTPDGIEEVHHYLGKKVYDRKGELMPMFKNLQQIQPRINLSKVTISVRQSLGIFCNGL